MLLQHLLALPLGQLGRVGVQHLVRFVVFVNLKVGVAEQSREAVILEDGARALGALVLVVGVLVGVRAALLPPLSFPVRRGLPLLQPRDESRVHLGSLALDHDAGRQLLGEFLLHLLLLVLLVGEGLRDRLGLAVQSSIDEEPVHVRAQHVGADEVIHPETRELLSGDELVIVVNRGRRLLLHLLRDVLEEGAPVGGRAERGREVHPETFGLHRGHDQTRAVPDAHVVDLIPGLDGRVRHAGVGFPHPHDVPVRADDALVPVVRAVPPAIHNLESVHVILREQRPGRAEVVQAHRTVRVARR